MLQIEIAQEIYAHAMAYYCSGMLISIGISNAKIQEVFGRASEIDFDNGGDTPERKAMYALVWNAF